MLCANSNIYGSHEFPRTKYNSITKEKVGIIKKNSILVLSKQQNIVRNIVRKEVRKQNAVLYGRIDWKILKKVAKSFY